MKLCSIEDCGSTARTRGWCPKHYKRWLKYEDPNFTKHIKGDDVARFWSHVTKTDTCWIWNGGLFEAGYGMFSIAGRVVYAHRWAYETFVGPIPDAHEIDHVRDKGCTSKACVNYEGHLEPVTHAENVRRGYAGRHMAAKTHCPHGHEYNDQNTRVYKGRRHCRVCDRERKR